MLPQGILLAYQLQGIFQPHAIDFIPIRHTQDGTPLEAIDVLIDKGIGIGFQQGHHHGVDADARIRAQVAGYFPERVARLHFVLGRRGSIAFADRLLTGHGRFRLGRYGFRHGFGGRLGLGFLRCFHGLAGRLWRSCRFRLSGNLGTGRGEYRRVQQQCVFLEHASGRPVGFQQEGKEGLACRYLAGDFDGLTAILMLDQSELQSGEIGRQLQAHTIKIVSPCQ